MPKTNAERQSAWRQRRAGRIAALEAEAADLRAETGILRADLATALDEAERLAEAACKHPAGAVDGGTCQACAPKSGSRARGPRPAQFVARAVADLIQRPPHPVLQVAPFPLPREALPHARVPWRTP